MSCPPEELLDILRQIPYPVRKRDVIYASHHNNVKTLLDRWLRYIGLDSEYPDLKAAVDNIPEVIDGMPVKPDEWNKVLAALRKIKSVLENLYSGFCPCDGESSTEIFTNFNERLKTLKNARSDQPIYSSQYNNRWEALSYLIRLSNLPTDIVMKFNIHVVTTGVRKYWDYIITPDNIVVPITPGKYHRIMSRFPLKFGIEDLTEEIGQTPDYDFGEPVITVLEIRSCFPFHGRIHVSWDASLLNRLYYDDNFLLEFTGFDSTVIEI